MYYTTNYLSPIGSLTIASDGKNIIGLWMDGQKYYGGSVKDELEQKDDLPIFETTKIWLEKYFNGEKPDVKKLPLAPIGSDFRKAVWDILLEIPYGEYITYGFIAKKLAKNMGKKNMSSQAVGGAVGHNPISVIIPCHRVIGANGSLTGFAGGIDKKVKLLTHENVNMSKLFVPKKGTAL